MTDNAEKPPVSDSKKYTLLAVAAVLLIGAYFFGSYIEINPTYDNAVASNKTEQQSEAVKVNASTLFPSDQILGDTSEKPAVTMIEYASLTCPHCAHFHNEILLKIKDDYINSKKIQYIFRDYPLDGAALKASLLAKCDLSKRVSFLDLLYKKQAEWTQGKTVADVEKNLMVIGKMGGLSTEAITACFNNKEMIQEILEIQKQASKDYNIEATPTIIINNEKFIGVMKLDNLKNILDTTLQEKTEIPTVTPTTTSEPTITKTTE